MTPSVRKHDAYIPLTKEQFRARFAAKFFDPAFDAVSAELDKVFEIAWDGYDNSRKAPRTQKAGPAFHDPAHELSIEWLQTRQHIHEAESRQRDPRSATRILLVSASPRNEHTCPGEVSKSQRLVDAAAEVFAALPHHEVDVLDLSLLAAEPMKHIHPCKACVSTSMPLCHWPCSCYPNHSLGQTNDWMNELYPRWAASHGVMIVSPVHWYQAPSTMKLMMDRLVCADGGNPDPTTTQGKDPAKAKELELAGWDYPKHLANRAFAIVTHGDAAGPEGLRRVLVDWLTDLGLVPAASFDTYIGYYEPYATSHEELDQDHAVFVEVKNAAVALTRQVSSLRSGAWRPPTQGLAHPREK